MVNQLPGLHYIQPKDVIIMIIIKSKMGNAMNGEMGNGDLVSTSPLKENAEIRGVVLVLWATNTLSSTLLGFYCFESQKREEEKQGENGTSFFSFELGGMKDGKMKKNCW
eukprot:TRINITY_DN633_c1_g1_i1.p1 TRINITY_DN633_c1_g1~~TRINITY_DN633_c1_g1_i1.p1  ORF type:complete len:110 (-),score=12.68 TRINITY_DN633_c1_g1_i1:82-411(-)